MILGAAPVGPFVLIPAEVVRTISKHAGDGVEAGGILLGNYRLPHIQIVTCSEPLPSDRRTSRGFDRRDPGHQLQALRRWMDSGKTVTFVGEWHTHPEEMPSPSMIDLDTWVEAQRLANPLPLVFAIWGYRQCWFGLGQHGQKLVKLNCIPSSSFDE
jgi:integrative and conjugative element protein (TIGR02256 family)